MKSGKEILRWLKANGLRTGGLTSQCMDALVTCVNMSSLVSWEAAPKELFAAFGTVARVMQYHTRPLLYHAIACELDWSHRRMIWTRAGLPGPDSTWPKDPHPDRGPETGNLL